MSPRTLATHLRRYPIWYAVGLVWLIAMVSLPIVRGTALADAFGGEPSGRASGTTTSSTIPALTPGGILAPGGSDGSVTTPTDASGSPVDTVAPSPVDEDDPLELVPPEFLDLIFDALPPIVFPALPPEVAPVFNAVAPLAATGCSGLGLAGVVVAVAAQSANGVPIERILPYLAPASTACASFPIPAKHTVCEVDKPFIQDLGGLATSPPILGLGIDQLAALETLLETSFGVAVPTVSEDLREQLDCELVSGQ